MNTKDRIRKNIVQLRKNKGWTQEYLAFEAQIGKSSLCEIESGKQSPTITTLEKIAEALNIELQELVLFNARDDFKQ